MLKKKAVEKYRQQEFSPLHDYAEENEPVKIHNNSNSFLSENNSAEKLTLAKSKNKESPSGDPGFTTMATDDFTSGRHYKTFHITGVKVSETACGTIDPVGRDGCNSLQDSNIDDFRIGGTDQEDPEMLENQDNGSQFSLATTAAATDDKDDDDNDEDVDVEEEEDDDGDSDIDVVTTPSSPNRLQESSATVKLSGVRSISDFVSSAKTNDISTDFGDTSPTHSESAESSEVLPGLTITSAFSLSADMWDDENDTKEEDTEDGTYADFIKVRVNEDYDATDYAPWRELDSDPKSSVSHLENESPHFEPGLEENVPDLSVVKQENEDLFSCLHCPTILTDQFSYEQHIQSHTTAPRSKVYLHQCSVPNCDFGTNIIREFRAHYSENHDNLSSYQCRWCQTYLNSLGAFLDHIGDNFVVPWVKCPHCHLKEKSKTEILRHISTEHPGESQRVIAGSMILCRSKAEATVSSLSSSTLSLPPQEKDHQMTAAYVSLLNKQKFVLNNNETINSNGNSSNSNNDDNNNINITTITTITKKKKTKKRKATTIATTNNINSSSSNNNNNNNNIGDSEVEDDDIDVETLSSSSVENLKDIVRSNTITVDRFISNSKRIDKIMNGNNFDSNRNNSSYNADDDESLNFNNNDSSNVSSNYTISRWYNCPDCIFSTTKAQLFLAHMKTCFPLKTMVNPKEVKFECKECTFATSSKKGFLNHCHVKEALKNVPKQPYGKHLPISNLDLPSKKIMPDKKKIVGVRGKKNRSTLRPSVYNIVDDKYKFMCPYCSESFEKINSMKIHIFRSHREHYNKPISLHQCLSCHMKSSSQLVVRQHIERTHFGRKSGILLIDEPSEIISRKFRVQQDNNKKLIQTIEPIEKLDSDAVKKVSSERCSSWGRSQQANNEPFKQKDVPAESKNTEVIPEKPSTEQRVSDPEESGASKKEELKTETPNKVQEMEIIKFGVGDHFTEYIHCPRCPYQSQSVMGFYGHIKRHENMVVCINTRRKYEFHKPKYDKYSETAASGNTNSAEDVPKTSDSDSVPVINSETELPAAINADQLVNLTNENSEKTAESPDEISVNEIPESDGKDASALMQYPVESETVIMNKQSESDVDKEEYSKLGGPVLTSKLSQLYTVRGMLQECNLCDYSSDFPSYMHRHLLSNHLNVHFWRCGYCFYRHLQQCKILRHCIKHHASCEPYAKWLGIPDWEKKINICLANKNHKAQNTSEAKSPKMPLSPTTTSQSSTGEEKIPPLSPKLKEGNIKVPSEMKIIEIEKLPGNLYKCKVCSYCSIYQTNVLRHISYVHGAFGKSIEGNLQSPIMNLTASVRSKLSGEKQESSKTDGKSENTSPVPSAPPTLYRCVFCNSVNMSADEVKKHMWQEHSDELTNVGILLKSKEESAGSSRKNSKRSQLLKKHLHQPAKGRKVKTQSKNTSEQSSPRDANEESMALKHTRRNSAKGDGFPEGSEDALALNLLYDENQDHPRPVKRPATKQNQRVPAKRLKQKTAQSKANERNSLENLNNDMVSETLRDREFHMTEKLAAQSGNDTESQTQRSGEILPELQKVDMEIYNRYIFKTYDGSYLCNFCITSMATEDEARQHILSMHPKKVANPSELPCQNFQIFRQKTRRPEIIVPIAAKPRGATDANRKSKNPKPKRDPYKVRKQPKKRKASSNKPRPNANKWQAAENKLMSTQHRTGTDYEMSNKEEKSNTDSPMLLADSFTDDDDDDVDCIFSWSYDDDQMKVSNSCTDQQQLSIVRMIKYQLDDSELFKCPFCQLRSKSHRKVMDHIRMHHLELEVNRCSECPYTSWFDGEMSKHVQAVHGCIMSTGNHRPPDPMDSLLNNPVKPDTADVAIKNEQTPSDVCNPHRTTNTTTTTTTTNTTSATTTSSESTDIYVTTDYRSLYSKASCIKNQTLLYTCTICSLQLVSQKLFFEHVTKHYGRIYQCSLCSFKTYPREFMENHIRTHQNTPKENINIVVLCHESLMDIPESIIKPCQIFKSSVYSPVGPTTSTAIAAATTTTAAAAATVIPAASAVTTSDGHTTPPASTAEWWPSSPTSLTLTAASAAAAVSALWTDYLKYCCPFCTFKTDQLSAFEQHLKACCEKKLAAAVTSDPSISAWPGSEPEVPPESGGSDSNNNNSNSSSNNSHNINNNTKSKVLLPTIFNVHVTLQDIFASYKPEFLIFTHKHIYIYNIYIYIYIYIFMCVHACVCVYTYTHTGTHTHTHISDISFFFFFFCGFNLPHLPYLSHH
ncbi:uncharacterized protein LOC115224524 [Octopus sinensis]|uniref:Uncharacterized protein LOC115224524 n=1 Tax=Octopus sinensis TaxID=2607531 RepID=A0A7E6FQM5_9MOLL|nr:uncharacterized protein LOC115224524 [Octopus sinensis]